MYWIVYKTTNTVNGKLYIGVHKTETPNQFDGYIGNGIKVGRNLENPKTIFQKALKKYGYAKFKRETLFVYLNPDEAYQKEAELVTLNFIKRDDVYNTSLGGANSALHYKKVYQYTLQGELLKVWTGGQTEIMDVCGLHYNELYWALTQKIELRQSYWSLTPVTDFTAFSKRQEHYVYQFDLTGNLVDIHENLTVLARQFNISRDTMKDVVSRKQKYRGFYWTLNVESIYEVIKLNQLFNVKRKYVQLVTSDNKVVKEYLSSKEAALDLGYKPKTISSIVSRHTLIKGQYYLRYLHSADLSSTPVLQIDVNTGQVVHEWPSLTACQKAFPKCKEVIKGVRHKTKGYTFQLKTE